MCPPKPLRYKGWASPRKNVCHRACRTCCKKCRRVPPGTYGNKPRCP
ncbi:hypothetical protein NC652_031641 [Populus alba x Populus x berolinensis]|nr:hypothetical protein NC652_031641 [Populus alba x Populus x berolinensis]